LDRIRPIQDRKTMLTVNQQNGIHLEKAVSWFIEHKLKLGDKVDHNRFDEQYSMDNHNVVDIVVKGKALVECTNPKETTFMPDDVMDKKLDYFQRIDPHHFLIWFLIISFANFSEAIKQRIKRMGIIPIETGVHAEKNNFWETIKRLFHTRLYSVLTKIVKSNLARPTKFLVRTIQSLLYSSPIPVPNTVSVVNTRSTLLTTNRNHLHQHTTSTEEDYNQYREDMKENSVWSVNHPNHQRIMDKLRP